MQPRNIALPGDCIGVNIISGMLHHVKKRGTIVSDEILQPVVASFVAKITVQNHPTQWKKNYQPVIDCFMSHVSCKCTELISIVDANTGKELETSPICIKNNQTAIVRFEPVQPFFVQPLHVCAELGRFVIRDTRVIGFGTVLSVEL